jgi:hypothetical protein
MDNADTKKNIVVVPEGQKAYLVEEFTNIYGTQHNVTSLEEKDKKKDIEQVM